MITGDLEPSRDKNNQQHIAENSAERYVSAVRIASSSF
jgi:hypothetical protein